MGDECSQAVVVPEPDLVGRDGVVLVDHRQDAQLEEPVQRPLSVAVVGATNDVVDGEQHLADREPQRGKAFVVAMHQQPLAHRCGRLLGGQVTRATAQSQGGQSGGNGSGRNQDDLSPGGALLRNDVD